ncbi:Erg28 protein [Massariosphaeria phaeospora]|uniref:Erg28 protein n=1 Tax=Massariosphaeria phaeospora TaxID=100035 RepID=A0A7C8IPW3_9PLEO|nr:Erg28 protein [Massariosphaeria phaeospora]
MADLSTLMSYLPLFDGLLPKWLLLVAIISVGNSIQSYATMHFTQRVYNPNPVARSSSPPPPASAAAPTDTTSKSRSPSPEPSSTDIPLQVTPLSARTFGTWTFLTSMVRLYAAYNIDDANMYQLAMWSYAVAWCHFMSEWWVFGTTRWGAPLAGPVLVSTGSLIWMALQWDYYVKA